jgi:hypothetical protein
MKRIYKSLKRLTDKAWKILFRHLINMEDRIDDERTKSSIETDRNGKLL